LSGLFRSLEKCRSRRPHSKRSESGVRQAAVNPATPQSSAELKFEIGHVLFLDIVGYSKLLINEQSEQIQKLKEIVPHSVSRLTSDHPKASVWATRAVRFARLDVVDRYWRRQLTGLPFRAAQSSRNGPVRPGQRFSEDRVRALLVEGDDATPLRWRCAAQLLPSERRHLRTPTRL